MPSNIIIYPVSSCINFITSGGTNQQLIQNPINGGISFGTGNTSSAIGSFALGTCNSSTGNYSSVGGGFCNISIGLESAIVGGQKNLAQGFNSFIGGGDCNSVCNSTSGCLSYGAVVAGGVGNNTTGGTFSLVSCCFTVAPTVCDAGSMSFVGGGFQNKATGSCSVVVGGFNNTASSLCSGILGGSSNTVGGVASSVLGGFNNIVCGNCSTVLGGCGITVSGNMSAAIGCNINAPNSCTFYSNNFFASLVSGNGGIVCAASRVDSPLICGTTSMCTPIIRATTACITGLATSGCAVCVGASGLLTAYTAAAPSIMVVGGGSNSTVRCGVNNTASGNCSASLGGQCNTASGNYSFVGGGNTNSGSGLESAIVGGQKNLAQGFNSFIGGGDCNSVCNSTSGCLSYGAVVAGGVGNNTCGGTFTLASCAFTVAPTICNAGSMSFIGGGLQNSATGACSAILGGRFNTASGGYTSVGGGTFNIASGFLSNIGGGLNNTVTGTTSFVGGGSCNTASGSYSTISAGYRNTASGSYSAIGGGQRNLSQGLNSFIGGGIRNTVCGACSSVLGGSGNTVTSAFSGAFGCGLTNSVACSFMSNSLIAMNLTPNLAVCADANDMLVSYSAPPLIYSGGLGTCSVVRNGVSNVASGNCSAALGGFSNTASGVFSFIGGGFSNSATGNTSSIVGGGCNTACQFYSTIVGGFKNNTNGMMTFIGGGNCNILSGTSLFNSMGSVIGGGIGNNTCGGVWNEFNCVFTTTPTILGSGACSTIGGGFQNVTLGAFSSVLGGLCNFITGDGGGSASVGGCGNRISSNYSFIGGGPLNTITSACSAILGGSGNTVSAGFSGAFGCGINASVACTFYVNNLCATSVGSFATCATSPLVCGTTSMCTPILRAGTACITGLATSGCAVCVGASGILTQYTAGGGGIIVAGGGTGSTLRCGLNNTSPGACSTAFGFCNRACGSYSVISGGLCNTVSGNYASAIVAGGCNSISNRYSFIGAGFCNRITASGNYNNMNFIGAGENNTISCYGSGAVIVNGTNNINEGSLSFIGTGYENIIRRGGGGSVIVGGSSNTICWYNGCSFIGGGTNNCIGSASGAYTARSSIVGGMSNQITGSAEFAVIAGGGGSGGPDGSGNKITGGCSSFIGAGSTNCVTCSYSGIMAGRDNTVSHNCSFIIGTALSSGAGSTTYTNALSKASGTFRISHPDPTKNASKYLQHSFVESPTRGDNIYRYKITTVECQASLPLPDYYKFLNENDQVWVSPSCHFGSAYGIIDSCQTCVSFTSNCDGEYNVLIIGTRKDIDAKNGFLGVEIWK